MTVTNQNFKVYRGNSFKLHVDLTQADGTPFDPTVPGVLIKWRLSNNWHSPEEEALVRKNESDGSIVVVTGGVEVSLEPGDTDLAPGFYYHEMKVWDGADVSTAMTGTAIIKKAVGMGDNAAPAAAQAKLSGTAPTRTP